MNDSEDAVMVVEENVGSLPDSDSDDHDRPTRPTATTVATRSNITQNL